MSDQHFPIKTFGPFPQNPTLSALRVDDFLSLEFEFVNLQVSTPSPGKPVLTIVNPAQSGFIIVSFPPQNIAEQAFWMAADEPGKALPVQPPPDQPPYPPATELPNVSSVALCRIAGASRLVFIVPSNAAPIPYGLQSLLEKCSELALNVAPTGKILASFPAIPHPVATGVLATSTLASVRAIPAVPLANLMVQHRAAMRTTRSLTFKTFGSAVAASTIANITSADTGSNPRAPKPTETAIEMPYRLIISPNQYGAWAHASVPVSSESGRTELWHTRLGCRAAAGDPIDESARTQRPFRNISAIWARDQANYPDPAPQHDQIRSATSIPFRASLDGLDRWNIVRQSRGFSDIVTNRLMLTSLGGWLDAKGTWPGEAVEEWRHLATMGRDHYARVVYKGFLFPFGHRASLVKITERMFYPTISGYLGNRAYLRQRVFVLVREQDKFYLPNLATDAAGARFDLQMPFQRVRITTMVTPNLDAPALAPPPALLDTLSCFCPRVGGNDFKFHLVAEDLEGNEIEFSAPLYFLDATPSGDGAPLSRMPDHLDELILKYWTTRGICDFQGRRLPLAESSDSHNPGVIKPGSTTFETASIAFSATRLDAAHVGALGWECHFYPKVVAANIIVPALK
ncbi:MAG: hypothetical protein JO251_19075, partial [Verrucomicrobia bacterium]|nr:hypothetical protein [Verrucomicrobiota bacterium]